MLNSQEEIKKWGPVLEHKGAPSITDHYRKVVTAKLLENTEKAIKEERSQANFLNENIQSTSAVSNFDPVLISLVRRNTPNLIAFDIAGVQVMNAPTGLIFSMKARYNDTAPTTSITTADTEALFNEPLDFAPKQTTAVGETMGGTGPAFGDMGFTIEKAAVEAKTRGLKAEYTMELAQDLKAVHGLDAETELASILQTELLGEQNREIINLVNSKAQRGLGDTTSPFDSTYDLTADADGRWAVEKFKNLMFQIEIEANAIAKNTRRGKGNFIICSSNVASALAAAGVLDYAPAIAAKLNVDDTGNTFAGVMGGRIKVYIDPFALTDYVTVGYKGTSPYDAGLFYCPYVPLTMVRAVDENTFQPKIGFKTRYGIQQNPFVGTATGAGDDLANPYFRRFTVTNIV